MNEHGEYYEISEALSRINQAQSMIALSMKQISTIHEKYKPNTKISKNDRK